MFGILVRSAAEALFITLLAWVLGQVVNPLLETIAVEAAEDDLLYQTLTAAGENFILVGILALFVSLIARAIVEGRAGSPGGF